jgi:hypothetical protein
MSVPSEVEGGLPARLTEIGAVLLIDALARADQHSAVHPARPRVTAGRTAGGADLDALARLRAEPLPVTTLLVCAVALAQVHLGGCRR